MADSEGRRTFFFPRRGFGLFTNCKMEFSEWGAPERNGNYLTLDSQNVAFQNTHVNADVPEVSTETIASSRAIKKKILNFLGEFLDLIGLIRLIQGSSNHGSMPTKSTYSFVGFC